MQVTSHAPQTAKCDNPELKQVHARNFLATKQRSMSRPISSSDGFPFSCLEFMIGAKM